MTFDPRAHTIKLPGRKGGAPIDYLQVKDRVRWLRDDHADAEIAIQVIEISDTRAVMHVRVSIPKGGSAEAIGSEYKAAFADYIEKAGTVALGRALAILGYGIEFADDLDEQREQADPKDYEIGQAAVMQPKTETKRYPTPQGEGGFVEPAVKAISDEMPDGTAREIRDWFTRRLHTIVVKPKPTPEQMAAKAQTIAVALKSAGLNESDRADAYDWLCGVRSGKDMSAEQLALLFRNTHRTPELQRCAIAHRAFRQPAPEEAA